MKRINGKRSLRVSDQSPPRFSWKDLQELLDERARPILSEEESGEIEAFLTLARITSNRGLGNFIGQWLVATIADAGDFVPFRFEEGTPRLPVDSHSLTVGMTGVGKTVFANIQIVRISLEYMR